MAPAGDDLPLWEVIGGADKGGIIVRLGQDLASQQASARLATGALVREVQLVGERLQFQLVNGSGPDSGWVSLRLKDKELLVPAVPRQPSFVHPSPAPAGKQPVDAPQLTPQPQPAAAAPPPRSQPPPSQMLFPQQQGGARPASRTGGDAPSSAAPGSTGTDRQSGKYADLSDDELRKACKVYGFYPGGLEDRKQAAALLEQVERLDKVNVVELRNEIRKRGFATTAGMIKEDMVQRLRDILIWERFRVGELRRVCRENSLPLQDVPQTRENLLQLLADATWQARGIPVWRLPSLILAFGVLDQIDALEGKDIEELAWMCEKRGLPVEDEPEQEILADRLRTVVVWEHLPFEELQRECEVMGVSIAVDPAQEQEAGAKPGFMWRGTVAIEKTEQRELVRRLSELFWQAPPAPSASGLLPPDDPGFAEQVEGFFARLQLDSTAGPEELKRAYKDLARKHHPDKNIGSEEQVTAEFQGISEAYEALTEYFQMRGF